MYSFGSLGEATCTKACMRALGATDSDLNLAKALIKALNMGGRGGGYFFVRICEDGMDLRDFASQAVSPCATRAKWS